MARNLELTIGPNYIPDWGGWEALREFIQNTLDSHQAGFKMDIRRNPNGTLVLSNQGAELEYNHLILGSSTKQGGGFRGQYGEGFKLAMMVLCRMAKQNGSTEPPLRIKTGSEIWRPTLTWSDKFKSELLNIEVTDAKPDGALTVYIPNISEALWKLIQQRVLDLGESIRLKGSTKGEILLGGGTYAKQLYVRGLWVSELSRPTTFGYNLNGVELDRDRKMADIYSLRRNIAELLEQLHSEQKMSAESIYNLLSNEDSLEAECIKFSSTQSLRRIIVEQWKLKNPNGVPVTDVETHKRIQSFGGSSVLVSRFLYDILVQDDLVTDADDFLKAKSTEIVESYPLESFFDGGLIRKLGDIKLRMELAGLKSYIPESVKIVRFATSTLHGLCRVDQQEILVSVGKCTTLSQFLDVYIHEMGHLKGAGDYTARHVDAITAIAAALIASYER